MRDDANDTRTSPLTTPLAVVPRRSGPPTGPRSTGLSVGLSVVLPPPAAVVLDLDARRARGAAAPLAVVLDDAPRAQAPAEPALSIQDRIRLRALEASRP